MRGLYAGTRGYFVENKSFMSLSVCLDGDLEAKILRRTSVENLSGIAFRSRASYLNAKRELHLVNAHLSKVTHELHRIMARITEMAYEG